MNRTRAFRRNKAENKKKRVINYLRRFSFPRQPNNPYYRNGIFNNKRPWPENKDISKQSKSNPVKKKNSWINSRKEVLESYYLLEEIKELRIRPAIIKKYPKVHNYLVPYDFY